MATGDLDAVGPDIRANLADSAGLSLILDASPDDIDSNRDVSVQFPFEEIPGASKVIVLKAVPFWEPEIVLTRRVMESPAGDD